jgi:hypothetical protein
MIKFILPKYPVISQADMHQYITLLFEKNLQNVLLTRGISTMISIKNIFLLAS